MRRALLLWALTFPAGAATPPDTNLLAGVLSRFVSEAGLVDYAGLHRDLAPLDAYVRELAAVSPDSHPQLFPSRDARLAYWMNAYNALVLWAFAKDYPEGTTRLSNKLGQFSFFYKRKFSVGGVERSLDDIETKSIRQGFRDPRIHFAINCASFSCPSLSRIAFTAANVQTELDRLTRLFVASPKHVKITPGPTPAVRLSSILKWYQGDFGGRNQVCEFLARYRPQDAATFRHPALKVTYIPYDWSLNRQPGP